MIFARKKLFQFLVFCLDFHYFINKISQRKYEISLILIFNINFSFFFINKVWPNFKLFLIYFDLNWITNFYVLIFKIELKHKKKITQQDIDSKVKNYVLEWNTKILKKNAYNFLQFDIPKQKEKETLIRSDTERTQIMSLWISQKK